MPNSITPREFDILHDLMKDGFEGMNTRLDTLNGRTRKVEISSAIQWVLWLIVGGSLATLGPYLLSVLAR